MPRRVYFTTHPNVVIDARGPVPEWRLSETGLRRMAAGLKQPWVAGVTAVFSSEERKARDGAAVLAGFLGLGFTTVAELGENDRSSTGFLPPEEFERVADQFFANPAVSVRGWETAVHAQNRIVSAVRDIVARDNTHGDIAIVSHGAVGALLYCHLAGKPISRTHDQPANGGGNYFLFELPMWRPESAWMPFDMPPGRATLAP